MAIPNNPTQAQTVKAIKDLETNVVSATSATATVAGTTKTTYTYDKTAIYAPNGLIMGGTAAAAGLVTRGVCGVSTPSTGGACTKDNLFVNYDGDNTYRSSRQLVLQAGSVGTHYGNNLYQNAAARGDAVKGWVEAQGYLTSAPVTSVNGQTGAVSLSIPTKTSELTNDSGFLTSHLTSINGLAGGQLTSALYLAGGDAVSGVANIQLDTNGQITAKGTTSTLFGRSNSTTLLVGHSSHALTLRGSATRPTYNGNSLALSSDIPSLPLKLELKASSTTTTGLDLTTLVGNGTLNTTDTYLIMSNGSNTYGWQGSYNGTAWNWTISHITATKIYTSSSVNYVSVRWGDTTSSSTFRALRYCNIYKIIF